MKYYIVVCRNITHAQRVLSLLENNRINGKIIRIPKTLSNTGCGHGVKIGENDLSEALRFLHKSGLGPVKIYLSANNSYREVEYDIS